MHPPVSVVVSVACRSPAHCIEYAKIILWPRERPDDVFDAGALACLHASCRLCGAACVLVYALAHAPLPLHPRLPPCRRHGLLARMLTRTLPASCPCQLLLQPQPHPPACRPALPLPPSLQTARNT